MPKESKSEAVLLTRKLIKETPMEGFFTFIAPPGQGEKLLHRMRVELSRLRSAAIGAGYSPKHFKIVHIETVTIDGKDTVKIQRTRSSNNVSAEVQELFEIIGKHKIAEAS